MENAGLLVRTGLSDYLRSAKSEIHDILSGRLGRKSRELDRVCEWGPDVSRRLEEFAVAGKMLRGALVLLGADLFSRERDGEELKVAAAVELLQSALLVHDDIMDRDEYRRGQASVYAQYDRLGSARGVSEAAHFGASMGICAGDVAIFTAFEILGGLHVPARTLASILSLVSKEMTYVGVAQMQDVYLGQSAGRVEESDVYSLYLYKTGRYTFSLPLMLGGLLAEAPRRTVDSLAHLGERLGILFQMKDDEIGLFGDADQTGKPCGSDIAEGKKTLYHLQLLRAVGPAERRRLTAILGNPNIGEDEIAYVRELVVNLGIRDGLEAEMERLADEAHAIADSLGEVEPSILGIVHELVDFNLSRRM